MSSQTYSIPNCQITPARLDILSLLVEYRSLSTRQVYSGLQLKATHKSFRRVQSDLRALRLAGLIEAFPISPQAGPRSELGWLLLMAGARLVGFEMNFDNQYRRKPDPQQLEQTGWKLLLEAGVRECPGWGLIKPLTPGQMRSLGTLKKPGAAAGSDIGGGTEIDGKTPQYHKLTEVLSWQNFHQTGRWPIEGLEGSHALGVPSKANDYLAFTPPRLVPTGQGYGYGNGNNIQEAGGERQTAARSYTYQTTNKLALRGAAREGDNNGESGSSDSGGSGGSGKLKASENAVVFILCPYDSTRKFWQSRLERYEQITLNVLIFGVFDNDNRALSYKKLLQNEGLRVTTFTRVRMILDGIWKPA